MQRKRLLTLLSLVDPADYIPSLQQLDIDVATIYLRPTTPVIQVLYDRWLPNAPPGPAIAVDAKTEILDAAIALVAEYPVDGVVTFSETILHYAAQVAEALRFRFHSAEAVKRAQDKYAQRVALSEGGVPCPRFALVTSREDLGPAAQHTGFPAVLKPLYGAGSYQVRSCRDFSELSTFYEEALATYRNPIVADAPPQFLVEELMTGVYRYTLPGLADYVSVESLIADGVPFHLAITDRTPLCEPFRETGLILPSCLEVQVQKEILEIATAAIRAVGLTWGASHIEVKLTPNGPKVIEVNARPGGPIPRLLRSAADYDMVTQMGRIALGELEPTLPVFHQTAGSLWFPGPSSRVRLAEIGTVEEAEAIRGVDKVIIPKRVNDVIDPNLGGFDLVAFAFAHGPTTPDLLAIKQEILKVLDPKYGPF